MTRALSALRMARTLWALRRLSAPRSRVRRTFAVAPAAALVVTSFGLVILAPAVVAQDSAPVAPMVDGVSVLAIDTVSEPAQAIVRVPGDPGDVSVTVNGAPASGVSTTPLAASGVPQDTVILLDTSEAAERDELLPALITGALDYVQGAPANEEIAVISAGGAAQIESGFTSGRERTQAAIETSSGSGRSVLWEAVDLATEELEDRAPGAVRNLVVFTATADDNSGITAAAARGNAISSFTSVYVVSMGGVDEGSWSRLATSTGGGYAAAPDATAVSEAATSFRALVSNTYAVRFASDALVGGGSMLFQIGDVSLDTTFIEGSVTRGATLAPLPADPGKGFLQDNLGLVLGVGLGAVAAALGAWAVASLTQPETDELGNLLNAYSGEGRPVAGAGPDDGSTGGSALLKNALFQRAVSLTNNFAEQQGFLPRVETQLEQAEIPLRAAEALTFYVGGIGLGGVVGLLMGRSIIAAIVGVILATLLPPMVLRFKAKRRHKRFVSQLPDTLTLLASTLKAGYSFMQGVEAVSKEIQDPMGLELRRVVTEAQLGRAVEDALDASAERMNSEDFAWAVMAVRIQREVGGNLAELLLTVSDTMTARDHLRGEVSALTAEGRMSAIILGALPVGLAVIMYTLNPEYTGLLFTNGLGNIMLGVAIVAAVIGFVWMKKIIDIKI